MQGGCKERKLKAGERLSGERHFYSDDLRSCCQPWWPMLNLSNTHGRRKTFHIEMTGMKIDTATWKQYSKTSKIQNRTTVWFMNPSAGYTPKGTNLIRHLVLTVAFFTITVTENPLCLLTDECVDKLWHMCPMGHYLARKITFYHCSNMDKTYAGAQEDKDCTFLLTGGS